MSDESELLPCECGWPQPTQMMAREICKDIASTLWNNRQTRIWCVGCGRTIKKATVDEAIAAWNRRPSPDNTVKGEISDEAVEAAWGAFVSARYGGHDSDNLMRSALLAAIPHLFPPVVAEVAQGEAVAWRYEHQFAPGERWHTYFSEEPISYGSLYRNIAPLYLHPPASGSVSDEAVEAARDAYQRQPGVSTPSPQEAAELLRAEAENIDERYAANDEIGDGYFQRLLVEVAALIESLAKERDEGAAYLASLLKIYVERYCSPVEQWAPLYGDLLGLISQFDNATTVTAEFKKERDEAREALRPFAEWPGDFAGVPNGSAVWTVTFHSKEREALTVADFRAARQALKEQ